MPHKKPLKRDISKRDVPIHRPTNEIITINQMSENDPRPTLKVKIGDETMTGLLDSGSVATVLGKNSQSLINRMNLKILPYKNRIVDANGNRLQVLGYCLIPYTVNDQIYTIPTIIAPNMPRELILGIDAIKKFKIQLGFVESLRFVDDDDLNAWTLTIEEKNS